MPIGRRIPEKEEEPVKSTPPAIDLRTRMGAENAPFGFGVPSDFSTFNPQPQTRYIPFSGGGRANITPEGTTNVVYPSRTDITGRNVFDRQNVTSLGETGLTPMGQMVTTAMGTTTPMSGYTAPPLGGSFYNQPFTPYAERSPMLSVNPEGYTPFTPPSERIAPLPVGLPPQASMSIEGGPVNLRDTTGMTAPKTAEQKGLQAIQTPRGTMYASDDQMANMMTPRTLAQQSSRSPAEQQALIAQMRQRGAELGRQRVAGQEAFFAQKRAERAALAGATVEAYKSGASPQSIREARAAYTSQQPSSIAGIQRQYAAMAPTFDRPMAERTAFVREPFGLPSGGPQPATTLATSTLGTNLGIGGFQNPALFSPIQIPESLMANNNQTMRRRRTMLGA